MSHADLHTQQGSVQALAPSQKQQGEEVKGREGDMPS